MKMGQFIGGRRSVLEKGRRVEEAFLKSLEEASVSRERLGLILLEVFITEKREEIFFLLSH